MFFQKKVCLTYNTLTPESNIQIHFRFFPLVADINGFLCVSYEFSKEVHFSSNHSTQQTAQVDYDLSSCSFIDKIHQKVKNS
jgi:hypothetical protein